ncbi:hypothetical protein U1Q18_050790 [Sarracenia purpurea var. burkii]
MMAAVVLLHIVSWMNTILKLEFFAYFKVVNLQAQLASLKELAARSFLNCSTIANSGERFSGKFPSYPQDVQSLLQFENSNTMPQLDPNLNVPCYETGLMNPNSSVWDYENLIIPEENDSFSSLEEASHSINSHDIQTNGRLWPFQ